MKQTLVIVLLIALFAGCATETTEDASWYTVIMQTKNNSWRGDKDTVFSEVNDSVFVNELLTFLDNRFGIERDRVFAPNVIYDFQEVVNYYIATRLTLVKADGKTIDTAAINDTVPLFTGQVFIFGLAAEDQSKLTDFLNNPDNITASTGWNREGGFNYDTTYGSKGQTLEAVDVVIAGGRSLGVSQADYGGVLTDDRLVDLEDNLLKRVFFSN